MFTFSVTAKWFNSKSSFHSIKIVAAFFFSLSLPQGQICQLKKNTNYFQDEIGIFSTTYFLNHRSFICHPLSRYLITLGF